MVVSQSPQLMNLYPQAVTKRGNQVARDALSRVFTYRTARWRGLGELPHSGLVLRDTFATFDARKRFNLACADSPEPPGCRCGDVITGRCTPAECKLFGRICTPINPIGPCMVSSEGTCQAWFKYNWRREAVSVGGEA
jgi:hydrogenase expression/formation protein HypD